MDTIWRVQNDRGYGPYQAWMDKNCIEDMQFKSMQASEFLDSHETSLGKHPTPEMDKKIKRCRKPLERHGFESLAQLKKWFSKAEIKGLKEYGFHVVTVKGRITAYGQHQVLFIPYKKSLPIMLDNV